MNDTGEKVFVGKNKNEKNATFIIKVNAMYNSFIYTSLSMKM